MGDSLSYLDNLLTKDISFIPLIEESEWMVISFFSFVCLVITHG